ncbi:MAG: hypothetical protein JNL43_07610 [Flavobacteriales bacterium]|nr:hypothetical protein [Flavobacteriales bacterium]
MAKNNALDWTVAPAPESKDHVRIDPQYGLFINGKWVKPRSGKYFGTIDLVNDRMMVCANTSSRPRSGERALHNAYHR